MSSDNKVLVLCATGKVGANVCKALQSAGFEVYGTTRGGKSVATMKSQGLNPVVCNYADKASLTKALLECQCKMVFCITDFFLAAGRSVEREEQQGRDQIDACKAAGVEFVIYSSACDAEKMGRKVKHLLAKVTVEDYLKASGLRHTILRPCAFFEVQVM